MADYTYNADDDGMDAWQGHFTSRMGDGSCDHEQAYIDTLKLLAALKQDGAMLDIGCGLGRAIEYTKDKIATIAGLEPDLKRYSECHARFNSLPKCQILNQMSYEYIANNPGVQYDLIVLGMVIQHVSTTACKAIIKDTCTLVKPDGVVVISTTHVPESLKGFSMSSEPSNAYIPEEEYNKYAENTQIRNRGIPVRRFSRDDLEGEVTPHFDILQWTQFSYYRPKPIGWFCKMLGTDVRTLRHAGNSQFVVLQKRG